MEPSITEQAADRRTPSSVASLAAGDLVSFPIHRVLAITAAGAAIGLVLAEAAAPVAGAATRAPYKDSAALGSIGLCNRAGHQITSGRVDARPFAWRAVSTQAAAAPYNGSGRTATLYAYQPQQGLTAEEWSGAQLTASSRYSNPAHPMAAATTKDESLEDFIEEFKPKWDGFLQLRLYLGVPDEETDTAHYATLNIEVTGKTWHAVGGATVSCRSGTAESLETLVRPTTTTTADSALVVPSPATSNPRLPKPGSTPGSSTKGRRS